MAFLSEPAHHSVQLPWPPRTADGVGELEGTYPKLQALRGLSPKDDDYPRGCRGNSGLELPSDPKETLGMAHFDLTDAQIANETLGTATARSKALGFLLGSAEGGQAAAAAPVSTMIARAVPETSARIAKWLLEKGVEQEVRQNARDALEVLGTLDPDVSAFLAMNGLFSAALAGSNLTSCMVKIGSTVAIEAWVALLARIDPKRVAVLQRRRGGLRGVPADEKHLARLMERLGADPTGWDNQALFATASPLVDAAWSTGMFEKDIEDDGYAVVRLTEEAALELEAMDASLPWQRPRLLPMVVPPKGWEDPDRAPYLTEAQRMYLHVLGRARGRSRIVVRKLWNEPAIVPFRTALDTLGDVPFRVDTDTLDALRWAWDRRLVVGAVPSRDRLEYGEPEGIEEMPEDRQKLERQLRREMRELNSLNRTLGAELLKDLDTARLMSGYPVIYQPHYADFRGRLYTASSLSHHRSDHLRAAFRFARPVELGERGEWWLSRHVANCASGKAYGKLDKASWTEREDWVSCNNDLLRSIATGWRDKPELWMNVDHPFQFLQAAREFARLLDHPGSPEGFKSDIIVGLDATCSGSQHYAAALRAEEEGRLVNLLPSDRPADVYAAVASRVVDTLRGVRDGEGQDATAAGQWLAYGVDRGTIKRQVMTFLYGSEVFGFRDQIAHDLMRPIKRKVLLGQLDRHPFGNDEGAFVASLVLAKAIWAAVQEVFPRTVLGMSWLRSVGSKLAKHGLGVEWTTPSGFPVVHKYERGNLKLVQFTLGNARTKLRLDTNEQKKLVAHKQRSALPPNFIHSLDASHLHLTVCELANRGVRDLAMIHDSFGTQPGNVELMSQTLRETFVGMYEGNDPFAEVYRWACEVLPEKARDALGPPPAKGSLDLSQVLSSPYFFC